MYSTRESATRAVTTPVGSGVGLDIAKVLACPHAEWAVATDMPGTPVNEDHSNCIMLFERCRNCAAVRVVTEGPQEEMDDLYGPWETLNPALGEPHDSK